MRFFKNWWVVTITCAILVALLLAVGLPIFVSWLQPTWVRVASVVAVAAIWGLFAFLRRRKAKRAADALAAELSPPSAADSEGKALAGRMGEALAKLKEASGKRRDYLYTRPWYVIIGPPGAGKTTALINSGLRFPFVDNAVKGVGGTRNLDFWFADEAVLVDTAGRYTTQDSDQQVDAKGWTSFLSLLKKHRPLQPINGVLVAIGVDELMAGDCARIDAHARAVRRRLVELRRTLEVAAPVYVLVTKTDLIAGFTQYFEDLDVDGRRAVLGQTLDWKAGRPSAETIARAFDEAVQATTDRQAKRLFEEVDPLRRSLSLGFPSQLQALRPRLARFLEGAFASGDEPSGQLRGFYFTSGVQEGTPLDRIMSGMADVFDRAPVPADGGRSGRAYFLNRLLGEVMFPEAGLVTMDPAARRRQRARMAGAFAAIAAVAVLTLGAWGVSYARNRSYQADLLAKTQAAGAMLKDAGADLKQVRDSDADLRAVLPALDALRALPGGYAERRAGGPPLSMRFGLYQTGLAREAEETYREALRRVLLPRLMLRLETVMRANAQDPMQVYEPLKVYLMLGQQGPVEPKTIRAWVTNDWATEVYPGADSQSERNGLEKHLAALLEDRDLASVWPDRKPPLDGQVVAQARAAIGTLSMADRAYAVMRQKAATAGPDWMLADILSQGDAVAFASPEKVLGVRVPYFFTRAGFEKTYTVGLATAAQDLKRDLWMLGEDANTGGVQAELGDIRPGVAGRYAREYIETWENVIKTLQPGSYFADAAAFGAMTKSPSPMKRVLMELRKNTIFAGGVRSGIRNTIRRRVGASRIGTSVSDFNAGRASGLDAGDEITAYFEGLHDYVGDGKTPAPIDEFVAALKQAGQAVIAAKSVGGGGAADATQASMAAAVASVRTAAAGAPPQLQEFVSQAAGGGSAAQTEAATGAVADAYAQVVLPACKEAAQERYPFFGGATADASAVEMLRVFGMGGVVDGFVQQRLKPLMDVAGPVWRWRADDPVASTLDPASAEQFAKTGDIRNLLVGGLPIKVSLVRLGSEVGMVQVASGGATHRFTAPGVARPLLWSINGGLPEASVTLYKAGAAAPGGEPQALRTIEAEGVWALFKLIDKAEKENAGPQSIKVTFGDGAASATLLIELPTPSNPFSRGGVWSFRCPTAL